MSEDLSLWDKLATLWRVAQFRPVFTAVIILLSLMAAAMEGIGLSFLIPIIEQARGNAESRGTAEIFSTVYETLGVPFTLETILVGIAVVMTVRYSSSFLVAWSRSILQVTYVRFLQTQAYKNALDAQVQYFDRKGSDEILNTIVTEAKEAGSVINWMVRIVEQSVLILMYFSIAFFLAPTLTLVTGVILGTVTYLVRWGVESGESIGTDVAEANEEIQTAAQAGTQGIRDIKIFSLTAEMLDKFNRSADKYVRSKIKITRNKSAMENGYELMTALTVFVLIYIALRFTPLSVAGLGVFLFAMFRLAPRVSNMNNWIYQLEGSLPHLVRTQHFIDELHAQREPDTSSKPVPNKIDEVATDEVSFSYGNGETVLEDVSFAVENGEFVAFVGPSGAGKSTIVSLLSRLYEPNGGTITADGTPIDEFDVQAWREHVSAVRQQPYIFNDTLWYNLTVANRDADRDAVERACEVAQVTEFFDELPNGYETQLGDNGVRLSGGQKQRVALARALLKESDLLLLDEATSDLDTNIESEVHDGIESLEQDRAMIVVAHRLSTVKNADRIYAVEDGRIVEQGTHGKLLANGGVYSKLYSVQD